MNLQIDHSSKLPLHVQVEELIRNLIASPEFMNGALLPKEVELANKLVSPEAQYGKQPTNWKMKAS
ncbi:MAG: hypothetical protein WKI04_06820 [Ferruginibacter sp.]